MNEETIDSNIRIQSFEVASAETAVTEMRLEEFGSKENAVISDNLIKAVRDGSLNAQPVPIPAGSLLQIPISVRVILGTAKIVLSKVLALGPGSIIPLDQKLSEPVLLLVNGNEFAKGTIVVIDEASGQLGITLTEIKTGSAA